MLEVVDGESKYENANGIAGSTPPVPTNAKVLILEAFLYKAKDAEPAFLYIVVWTIINTLLFVEAGVIETDNVFDAVTKEVELVLLVVESVAVTTCNTLPPVPAGSVTVLPVKSNVELISAPVIALSVIPSDFILVSGSSKFLV